MIKKTIFKKPIIIITENAWNKIININKKVIVNNGFLFSAKTGGCNGFNYNFNNGMLLGIKNTYTEDPIDNNILSVTIGVKW